MIKESTYIAFIIIDFLEEDEAFHNLSFYYVSFYNISETLYVSSDTNMRIINVQINLWMKMLLLIFFCADEWINWMNDIFHNKLKFFVTSSLNGKSINEQGGSLQDLHKCKIDVMKNIIHSIYLFIGTKENYLKQFHPQIYFYINDTNACIRWYIDSVSLILWKLT